MRIREWSSDVCASDLADIAWVVAAAILVGGAGATFDIVIDAYRIEILEPRQLGVGSGMSQYGWRIGSAGPGALALVVAVRWGGEGAYPACPVPALPAMLAGLVRCWPIGREAWWGRVVE